MNDQDNHPAEDRTTVKKKHNEHDMWRDESENKHNGESGKKHDEPGNKCGEPEKKRDKTPRRKNDILLKSAFEDCFQDLLRFFYKDADQIFDMDRPFEFMDKELREITPERLKEGGTRITDLLVKVFQLDGREQWLLLHMEIQAKTDDGFGFRMFEYYYRVLDRFKMPVVAIALFTGAKTQVTPDEYTYALLETEIIYRYKTYQIFQHTDQELLDWDNPFALVVLAAKKAHLENKIPERALNEERRTIARRLIESRRYDHEKIEKLIFFLKNILFIKNKEINSKFDQEISELTGGKITMGIVETIKMLAKEEGERRGELKGERRGKKEGKQEGIEQKGYAVVENLILKLGLSDEQAADIAEVSISFVQKVRTDLQAKQ